MHTGHANATVQSVIDAQSNTNVDVWAVAMAGACMGLADE